MLFASLVAAAAAESLQSCLTLCDPRDGSPLGSSVPGILQARILEWVAISFSNAWKWKVKVKSLGRARLLATPWTAAHQAPPSMGFSRQEYSLGKNKFILFATNLQRDVMLLVAQKVKDPSGIWDSGFGSWIGKIPWRREWQHTSVFLPGEFQAQRNLAGYSPQGCKESTMTEQLALYTLRAYEKILPITM